MDLIFRSTYDLMRLPPTVLKSADTPLYGCFGHNVQLYRAVKLLIKVGSHPAQATVLTNFLIMDALGVYNTIIRKSTLNALRAVASTNHLVLKFPTPT